MKDGWLGQPTTVNSELLDAVTRSRHIKSETAKLQTGDLYVVKSYDPAAGTVDVVSKTDPDAQAYLQVPVAMQDAGGLAIYQPFRTIDAGDRDATVGWLAFPRTDSRFAYETHARTRFQSGATHQGHNPIFIPGVPMRQDAAPPGYGTLWSKGDAVLQHRSGSAIVFKANGDIIIAAAGVVYELGGGVTDTGTTSGVSLGGGPTDAASTHVKAN